MGEVFNDDFECVVVYASWETSVTEDSVKVEAVPFYNIVHLAINYCFLEVIFEIDCAFIIPFINNDMFT
jgi:hypothetical protein